MNVGQLTSLTVWVRSRTAQACHTLSCMYFVQDKRTEFSVVIKIKGNPPRPWRWEIYRVGRSKAIAQSSQFFSTVSVAKKAGDRALTEPFKKQLML
jgi:hypothetical protein